MKQIKIWGITEHHRIKAFASDMYYQSPKEETLNMDLLSSNRNSEKNNLEQMYYQTS